MKMKSLAMSLILGLAVLLSFSYIAPAIADDDSFEGNDPSSMPMLSDSGMPAQSANPSPDLGANNPAPNNAIPNNPNAAPQQQADTTMGSLGNIGSSNEQGGPDTATGDDDY